jgi:putative SOS response-associated peptidase YedK
MCGYFGNTHESPAIASLLNQLQIPLPYPRGQYYMLRTCDGLVARGGNSYEVTPAIWWYALKWQDGKLEPNRDITSFNARNLESRLWRKPINERRGLVFASEIGETKGKQHYLMRAPQGLALGAVYQDVQTDQGPVRSMALITRPPHPRFSQYHDKAIPLFLPLDTDIVKAWLDPGTPASDPAIQELLESPRITTDLEVTPVKTFKRGETTGKSETLKADETERQ